MWWLETEKGGALNGSVSCKLANHVHAQSIKRTYYLFRPHQPYPGKQLDQKMEDKTGGPPAGSDKHTNIPGPKCMDIQASTQHQLQLLLGLAGVQTGRPCSIHPSLQKLPLYRVAQRFSKRKLRKLQKNKQWAFSPRGFLVFSFSPFLLCG